jgi:hypothetical protein
MGLQRGHAASLLHAPEAKRLLNACAADAVAARAEFLWAPPAALHKPLAGLLEDPRDLPILFLYLNVLLSTAPAVASLFWGFPAAARPLPHLLGAAYLVANYVAYLGRFMLSLHYSQHRRLFKRGEAGWSALRRAADSRSVTIRLRRPADLDAVIVHDGLAGLWPLNLLAPVLLAPLFGVPSGGCWTGGEGL